RVVLAVAAVGPGEEAGRPQGLQCLQGAAAVLLLVGAQEEDVRTAAGRDGAEHRKRGNGEADSGIATAERPVLGKGLPRLDRGIQPVQPANLLKPGPQHGQREAWGSNSTSLKRELASSAVPLQPYSEPG